ncbi:MAG: radical SAM protein [Candidatus Aenigmatarchaeota archaeon]
MFEGEIAKRILEWKNRKPGPFEVQFNPTNKCNLKCRFCWLRDFDDDNLKFEELDTKKYKEIIRSCHQMKVRVIEITGGGEPFMRNDILILMKTVKMYNIFGKIVTNGTLLNEEMVKNLIKIGWDEIVFSLDAPDKKINDYLRGESFDKIVKAIKTLQIKKIESKRNKPTVSIHMVLCNKNFHLLPKMFEFAYNLSCRNLLIEPIVLLATKTKSGKELMFKKKDRKNLLKYIREAIEVAYKYNFQTNVDKLDFRLIENTSKMKKIVENEGVFKKNSWSSLACYQPFYRLIIRPWGVVGPCCMFDNVGENVKDKSLKEIWFGEFFEKIRKKIRERDFPDFCSKCNPTQVQENRKIREEIRKLGG